MLSQGMSAADSTVMILAAQMPNRHLHEPLVQGLQVIYDAEKQLVAAIPTLIRAATSPALKEELTKHFQETKNHVIRLENIFSDIGASAQAKPCAAMKGLIEEGAEAIKQGESKSRDARIIAAAQKVEHYEIASQLLRAIRRERTDR